MVQDNHCWELENRGCLLSALYKCCGAIQVLASPPVGPKNKARDPGLDSGKDPVPATGLSLCCRELAQVREKCLLPADRSQTSDVPLPETVGVRESKAGRLLPRVAFANRKEWVGASRGCPLLDCKIQLTGGAGCVDGLSLTVNQFPLPSSVRSMRIISSKLNGRAPRRPNTETWFPLSSTARSRSSGLEIASASPLVLNVAINTGFGRGLNPAYSGT